METDISIEVVIDDKRSRYVATDASPEGYLSLRTTTDPEGAALYETAEDAETVIAGLHATFPTASFEVMGA